MPEENKPDDIFYTTQTDESTNEKPQEQAERSDKTEPAEKTNVNISVDENTAKKLIYSLCYLWGILFFLPLILYPDDARTKRHANEGLVLLLFSVIGNVVFGVLTRFGWIFGALAGVYSLLLLILGIIGIVYVVTDQNKDLPVLGAIKIIK